MKNFPVSDYSKSVFLFFFFLLEKRQVKEHMESVLNTIMNTIIKYGLVSSGTSVFAFPEESSVFLLHGTHAHVPCPAMS